MAATTHATARSGDNRGDRDDGQRADRGGSRDATRQRDQATRSARIAAGRRHRNRPDINVDIGSSYRGPRYYAPVALRPLGAAATTDWSPIGYAPWSSDLRLDRLFELRFYSGVGAVSRAMATTAYGYDGYAYARYVLAVAGVRL